MARAGETEPAGELEIATVLSIASGMLPAALRALTASRPGLVSTGNRARSATLQHGGPRAQAPRRLAAREQDELG